MKMQISGKVVEVETRSYTNKEGVVVHAFDAFIAGDNARFGADRVSGPADLAPVAGDSVSYGVLASPRVSKDGRPWLSVWCVEKVDTTAKK